MGKRENPYPYIKSADYFALLSKFEGYGMVIDEAKILNKNIIITDTAAKEAVNGYSKKVILQNTEDAIFEGKINLQNFESYQIKLLMELFQEMNEGFITLGGLTSKGFGFVSAFDFKLKLKYYNIKEEMPGYEKKLYYQVKDIEGIDNIIELVKDVDMEKVKKGGAINEQAI